MDPGSRVVDLGRRWIVAYLVVYMLPFPLGQLPGVDELVNMASGPWHALVAWVGEAVFGVEAVQRYSGSGDTMYHYVALVCVMALATMIALIWPSAVGERAPTGRVMDRVRAYASVYLGGWLLIYGWSKLIPTQFQAPGPDRWLVPYGDSSPMGLLWTFMGASAAYQMLAGLAEVVSGALLFWRRTRTLGALLAVGVMGNVVALNYCYDVAVKLFSSHLWVLALFILAPDLRRLLDLLWFHRTVTPRELDPYPITSRRWRRAAVAGKLVLIGLLSSGALLEGVAFRASAERAATFTGIYRVGSFSGPSDDRRWLRVGLNLPGRGAIQRIDGTGERFRVELDEQRSVMRWTRIGAQTHFDMQYQQTDGDSLKLWGQFEGASISVLLRRDDDVPILSSHGFHWVQEQSFNR